MIRAARTLVAAGSVRREWVRLGVQLLLLSLIVPGIFVDRPTQISWPVLALMGASAGLLVNTIADARERYRLARVLDAEGVARRIGQTR